MELKNKVNNYYLYNRFFLYWNITMDFLFIIKDYNNL